MGVVSRGWWRWRRRRRSTERTWRINSQPEQNGDPRARPTSGRTSNSASTLSPTANTLAPPCSLTVVGSGPAFDLRSAASSCFKRSAFWDGVSVLSLRSAIWACRTLSLSALSSRSCSFAALLAAAASSTSALALSSRFFRNFSGRDRRRDGGWRADWCSDVVVING